jgi:hypothetical protein
MEIIFKKWGEKCPNGHTTKGSVETILLESLYCRDDCEYRQSKKGEKLEEGDVFECSHSKGKNIINLCELGKGYAKCQYRELVIGHKIWCCGVNAENECDYKQKYELIPLEATMKKEIGDI